MNTPGTSHVNIRGLALAVGKREIAEELKKHMSDAKQGRLAELKQRIILSELAFRLQ